MEWSELPYFRIPKTQHNKTDTEFSGINIGSRIQSNTLWANSVVYLRANIVQQDC